MQLGDVVWEVDRREEAVGLQSHPHQLVMDLMSTVHSDLVTRAQQGGYCSAAE